LKLPAKSPGEQDVQTIASTAPGATITPLNRSWIDVPRKRVDVESHILLGRAAEAGEVAGVFAFLASDEAATAVDPNSNGEGPFQRLIHLNPAVGREQARNLVALPATNDVLRRFNRDTEWLATGILSLLTSAALVLAVLIQEGQPKAVDQAKEERQTGGNALVNANPGPLPIAARLNAASSTGEITSGQATSVDHGFNSPLETPSPQMETAASTQTPILALTPETSEPDLPGERLVPVVFGIPAMIVRPALETQRRVQELQKRELRTEFRNTHFGYHTGEE
jgi:hypothetical protein